MSFNNIKHNRWVWRVFISMLSHLVDRHLSCRGDGLRLHVRVHSAVLRQSISQVHQVVIQPLLQLQHFNLLDTGAVQLVADLHTWSKKNMIEIGVLPEGNLVNFVEDVKHLLLGEMKMEAFHVPQSSYRWSQQQTVWPLVSLCWISNNIESNKPHLGCLWCSSGQMWLPAHVHPSGYRCQQSGSFSRWH